MHNSKILVTGGTGFAGSHLLEALQAKGYTNLHATQFGSQKPIGAANDNVTFHQLDLTDKNAVLELISQLQPTQIYQLASFAAVGKSFETADALLKNNTALQLNVLEAVRQACPKTRVLSIGSAEEYGLVTIPPSSSASSLDAVTIDEDFPLNPINPYAVSKVTQDLLAYSYFISYQLQIVRVRPFNHIGERQSPDFVVPAFASQIVKIEKGLQEKLLVGNLDATRDFTDVKDMVQAYILLMEKGSVGEVYNVGSGQGWKIRQILDTLIQFAKVEVKVEVDPTRLRPSDIPHFVSNNHKIHSLGWQPTIEITDTLQRILNEWRNAL